MAPLIERTYAEGGPFQWARETLVNSAEAGASRVEFGIEWQGVENKGVYRRFIACDGCGMDGDHELRYFFSTFGGGGKAIGGQHENYGVGAKTSLMPWNHEGIIVISWKDGDAAMIHIRRDPVSGEYGLLRDTVEDEDGGQSLSDVWQPNYYDDELGIDFSTIREANGLGFIQDHGTIILLLGNSLDEDTILGDRSRGEDVSGGLIQYLDTRFWNGDDDLPETRAIYMDRQDKAEWPEAKPKSYTSQHRQGTNLRRVHGALGYLKGHIEASGTEELDCGTKVHWFLRDSVKSSGSWGDTKGFYAVLHRNELYHLERHHARFRSFGITESSVKDRLFLLIEPPLAEKGKVGGVYTTGARYTIMMNRASGPTSDLPWHEWADEFANRLPQAILDALRAVAPRQSDVLDDDSLKRLKERFSARWRVPAWYAHLKGKGKVTLTEPGSKPKKRGPRSGKPSTGGGGKGGLDGPNRVTIGTVVGTQRATQRTVGVGLPKAEWAREVEFANPWVLASWTGPNSNYPAGLVQLNQDHVVIVEQIRYHQDRLIRQDQDSLDKVEAIVKSAYAKAAVAKVTHVEALRKLDGGSTKNDLDDAFRSDQALTTALMGLVDADALIGPALGTVGKSRK